MTLKVDKYQLVTPGDLLAVGRQFRAGMGVYREDDQFFAAVTGLASVSGPNVVGVVPLQGSYLPMEGDIIIGKILAAGVTSWRVDIRGPYLGVLSVNNVTDRAFDPMKHEISRFLIAGDIIMARVVAFDRSRDPMLTMMGRGLRKLVKGRLVEIDAVKVPRVIGKKGSMISMMKKETNSQIFVGQNGRILVASPNNRMERLVVEALRKVEREAHTGGLTDRVRNFLVTEKKRLAEESENNG
jgi:exosome complex component RRP4